MRIGSTGFSMNFRTDLGKVRREREAAEAAGIAAQRNAFFSAVGLAQHQAEMARRATIEQSAGDMIPAEEVQVDVNSTSNNPARSRRRVRSNGPIRI